MHHDTITVIDTVPSLDSEPVYRIHDNVIREGYGFIETATERLDVSMNQRNSNKLATLMTESPTIHLLKDGFHGLMYNPRTERNDDNTVFLTFDE